MPHLSPMISKGFELDLTLWEGRR